ncbi:MAG: flagellar export chaperone FliS [Thermodesulfobacteriota bacterium]|nr:flagellar export chaperone FliS [Thermodesulfobacteriota bacterium]
MNTYMNQYQNNHIQTASPEKILIMLYDGAIRFCRQAIEAMAEGNKEVQNEKISRTMAIVAEFAISLDHEIGGEIATDLDSLYMFMIRELTRANIEKDRKALETVEELLSGLRDTWVKAADIYAKERQVPMQVFGSSIAVEM